MTGTVQPAHLGQEPAQAAAPGVAPQGVTPPQGGAQLNPSSGPNFIKLFNNTLDAALCTDIIRRFEADTRKGPSTTATRDKPLIRTGTMLSISEFPDWGDVVAAYETALDRNLRAYGKAFPSVAELLSHRISFRTPPILERNVPGEGFAMHIDASVAGTHSRTLACLTYLNDVEAGGATEFPYQQMKVQPRAGAMLMFPPFWTHPHRGAAPKAGMKYKFSSYVVIRDDWVDNRR